ncbi:CHAD domain-containing protein [Streptomyces sp. PTM05]|uniref:CHAD domain-containing protein n=1 Tax=Streptantibioticus parmotrematis TaxID=2873249 RepID=A0ABS7QQW7_9ACTN|nr:CHAD domain-containing protein [Streptantibioticus parmotrematis]MBY8885064.1 CHAD domain-containing protein [Streptantibioticus parmotrematis]
MVQRHPDTLTREASAGELLGAHLAGVSAQFLRALRSREQNETAASDTLSASARRISAALHTYEPLVDAAWARTLRTELAWLGGTLSLERRLTVQLARVHAALHRLATNAPQGADSAADGADAADDGTPDAADAFAASAASAKAKADAASAPMAIGAARAGALLERQLTLARTRAHSATLSAFGSARFHAVADSVALLASDLPFTADAGAPAAEALAPLAERARLRLADEAALLPLPEAGYPHDHHALNATLAEAPDGTHAQDAPWHRVRELLRVVRYAQEVLGGTPPGGDDPARLRTASHALDRHREAAEAARAVAAAARTPRITPATAYALGVLHADQRAEVEAARHAFGRLWQRTTTAPTAAAPAGTAPAPAPAP